MRVFLDASVFIWAAERPKTNSAEIVRALLGGRLNAIVDEQVLAEVGRYMRARRGRSHAWLYAQQLRRRCVVVASTDCDREFAKLPGTLKPAARLHLVACRTAKCEMLVAFDTDFSEIPEYRMPREAAKRLGLHTHESAW